MALHSPPLMPVAPCWWYTGCHSISSRGTFGGLQVHSVLTWRCGSQGLCVQELCPRLQGSRPQACEFKACGPRAALVSGQPGRTARAATATRKRCRGPVSDSGLTSHLGLGLCARRAGSLTACIWYGRAQPGSGQRVRWRAVQSRHAMWAQGVTIGWRVKAAQTWQLRGWAGTGRGQDGRHEKKTGAAGSKPTCRRTRLGPFYIHTCALCNTNTHNEAAVEGTLASHTTHSLGSVSQRLLNVRQGVGGRDVVNVTAPHLGVHPVGVG